jgi:hypothetical protein
MSILISLLLIFGLPLIGVALAGLPVAPYLRLPPPVFFLNAAPFSWIAFAIVAAFIALTCGPVVRRLMPTHTAAIPLTSRRPFPWWGWIAVTWTAVWWVLAWTRFDGFRPFQAHTFTPLWLGYIVIINAITHVRTGVSLLTHRPRYLLTLFPSSSAFWWSFEYLNRFLQNWHYHGTDGFTTGEYILLASFSFSTVLPAVISTRDLLMTFPRLRAQAANLWRVDTEHSQWIALGMFAVAAAAMLLIGVMPNYLFPLLWMAPVLVITSVQRFAGQNTIFSRLKFGDWTPVLLPGMAALICGFFWEMWNFHSLAHWTYTVPFVNRFQVFEMPLLGYAGYLPFGLECAAIAGWMTKAEFVGSNRPAYVEQHPLKKATSSVTAGNEGRELTSQPAA